MLVTPASEFVVAPAGYSLQATTPAFFALAISSGVVLSVRYKTIKGLKFRPAGITASIRCW